MPLLPIHRLPLSISRLQALHGEAAGKFLFEALMRHGLLWRRTKGSPSWKSLKPNHQLGYIAIANAMIDIIQRQLLVAMFADTPMEERN